MQALNDKLRFANINLITLIIWEIAKKIKDLKIIEKNQLAGLNEMLKKSWTLQADHTQFSILTLNPYISKLAQGS